MPGGKNILMWLRADLRTVDNPALHRASKLPLPASRIDYPRPIVDHAKARLRTIAAFGAL